MENNIDFTLEVISTETELQAGCWGDTGSGVYC